jgi:hypothetical protein
MARQGRRREFFEALVRIGLGDRRAALSLLEQAWERRDPNLLSLPLEVRFAPLKGDPRFEAIEEKIEAPRWRMYVGFPMLALPSIP